MRELKTGEQARENALADADAKQETTLVDKIARIDRTLDTLDMLEANETERLRIEDSKVLSGQEMRKIYRDFA
ncbi:MAG: hypothetical protein JKX85_00060 [Phycisphaeraceae bacterium]|nr:hypothetical protein [Phycisphaeraceae bacterium]